MSTLKSFDLTGKTALVTGCKRGIGKAIAIGLAEAGADIIGVSATLETEGSAVEKEVTALGRKFKGYAADFADRKALHAFISQVKADFPVIDILVNNAGTILRAPAAEHSDEYWDKFIEVNLNSQFVISREIGRDMIARGSGKIIFTASLLTFQGGITVPGYAASKGGIISFTRAMASYYAKHHIRANVIAPGLILTPMSQRAQSNEHIQVRLQTLQPLTGAMGQPEDIAGAAAYLASDDAKFVTGTVLTVDGGWTMR